MNEIFTIAWREYKQYVFSRGFLLFLLMFPLGMVFIGGALGLLERNKPIRYFVVHDISGRYSDAIDLELEKHERRGAMRAWDAYVTAHAMLHGADPDELQPPFAPADSSNKRIEEFYAAGGFEAAQEALLKIAPAPAIAFSAPTRRFQRIDLPDEVSPGASLAEAEALLRPYLIDEKTVRAPDGAERRLFAAILIPGNFGRSENAEPAQFWSRNLTDPALESYISTALNSLLRRELFSEFGLPPAALDEVAGVNAPMASFSPHKAPDEAELDMQDRIETMMPAALTYMLLVIIFGVGNLLLTNTIEERSNKIVEILLSSVTANQLMMGKLIGIGAVGLTMPMIFLAGGGLLSLIAGDASDIANSAIASLFSTNLVFVYLFYFFCAYLIFSMIFLAIGAVSNSLQDAQSYMGPVMLIVFAPMPFMLMVFQNPNGLAATILTWIPIYTPYAVMMRANADPPMLEIVGATILMLLFAGVMIRVMGRIFRQAILQAAPPKMRDVWSLARSATD
ncbi:MAG: ABC transporter permease [Marinicaulis sp.]|nr:ABC transporter permease [Marinicaulis sp.]